MGELYDLRQDPIERVHRRSGPTYREVMFERLLFLTVSEALTAGPLPVRQDLC